MIAQPVAISKKQLEMEMWLCPWKSRWFWLSFPPTHRFSKLSATCILSCMNDVDWHGFTSIWTKGSVCVHESVIKPSFSTSEMMMTTAQWWCWWWWGWCIYYRILYIHNPAYSKGISICIHIITYHFHTFRLCITQRLIYQFTVWPPVVASSTRGMATESIWFGHETRLSGGATEFLSPVGPGGLDWKHLNWLRSLIFSVFSNSMFFAVLHWLLVLHLFVGCDHGFQQIHAHELLELRIYMQFEHDVEKNCGLQRQNTWNSEALAWFEFDPIFFHHSLIFVSHSTTGGRTPHAEAIWYCIPL